jgi:hypothetical protein
VQVALRPEQLSLASTDQEPAYALHGTVETAVFVGSLQVFLVRALGMLIHVHALAGGQAAPFREGDNVLMVYSPDNVRTFPM